MKKIVLASLIMACLPLVAMAQSADDDLYFIPKKKTEKKEEVKEVRTVAPQKQTTTNVYAAPGSTVVVKDVKGRTRDVDEYNRRFTSRDNTFSMDNDTLYIEEKPLNERGEWVNEFQGSQDDYEYAMRIVRFRNPRYAIPVSSPLYWDVVYGLPSWNWNVYDDGLYAYAFPTFSNRLWWDWRWNYPYWSSWTFNFGGWGSPWYGSYYPGYWGGGYWGGGYWGWHNHYHNHYYPSYGWGGGSGSHGWYGSNARNPGIHAGRYENNYRSNSRPGRNNSVNSYDRNSRNSYTNSRLGDRNSSRDYRNSARSGSTGRVVSGSDQSSSIRPSRGVVRTRTGETISTGQAAGVRPGNSYTRPNIGTGSSYNRPSSTRSSVGSSYQGSEINRGAATRGSYRTNSGSSSRESSSYRSNSGSSSYSSGSSSSSSRSSYSSGGGGSTSRSSGSSGGGGSRRR